MFVQQKAVELWNGKCAAPTTERTKVRTTFGTNDIPCDKISQETQIVVLNV